MKNKALDLWFDIIHHGEEKEINNQYLGLIEEETKELLSEINVFRKGNWVADDIALRKEMVDAIVVIQGWYHKAGLSLEDDMNAVCESNMSKIYLTQEEAFDDFKNVQEKYKIKCFIKPIIIGNNVYYTIRRTKDGKILKPSKYKKAEL